MPQHVVPALEGPVVDSDAFVSTGPVLLPGEVPLLRTSERGDFRRCPWLWDKVWVRGFRKKKPPVWAWFGTAIHAALEVYYPPGKRRAKTSKVLDAFNESVGEHQGRIYTEYPDEVTEETLTEIVDARVLGEAMLRGYIDHYEGDNRWEVIHTEQPFQIDVIDPDTGETIVVYAGTWDSLMRDRWTKEFWLWDHKTRKTFPTEGKWNFYNINDQAGSYLWVAPEVLRHLGVFTGREQIQGLVFNALKKTMPDDRPRNAEGLATNKPTKEHYWNALINSGAQPGQPKSRYKLEDLQDAARRRGLTVLGDVSARQQGELFHREEIFRTNEERVRQSTRVQAEALAMSRMRSGELPLWKYPTEECTRCPMFDYCELDEQDSESAEAYAQAMFKKTDPYRDHREDMKLKRGVAL